MVGEKKMVDKYSSKYLSRREMKGLEKMGDIMIPGDDTMPSFSQTGCVAFADDAVAYVDPIDLKDLKMLLGICGILPKFMVRFFLWLFDREWTSLLRFANFGVRGLIFSLYYSNKVHPEYKGHTPHEIIGYEIKRVPKE